MGLVFFRIRTAEALCAFAVFLGFIFTSVSTVEAAACPNITAYLYKGITHPQVVPLKKFLSERSFLEGVSNTAYFGIKTEQAVKAFQNSVGLEETGATGPRTRQAIRDACSSASAQDQTSTAAQVFSIGSRGPEVTAIQLRLVELGYLSTDLVTGYYGSRTRAAVRSFQLDRGLATPGSANYGVVDTATYAALFAQQPTTNTATIPNQQSFVAAAVTSSCTFNGITIANGGSVSAYQYVTVPFGQTCGSPQTRVCTNGVLSGSYQAATCTVQDALTCLWGSQTIANGDSVTAYQAASVVIPNQCASELRMCNNGVLSGTYQAAQCTQSTQGLTSASCSFNGTLVIDGASVNAYQNPTVPFGQSCGTPQTRTCTNGTLSGSYTNASCTVQSAAACSFNGSMIQHGGTVTAYQTSSVSAPATCQSVAQTRACNNGVLSGTYAYAACTVQSTNASNTTYPATFTITPTQGIAPLSVTWNFSLPITPGGSFTWPKVDWGTGLGAVDLPNTNTTDCFFGPVCKATGVFTYSASGTYIVRLFQNTTKIAADVGITVTAPNQSAPVGSCQFNGNTVNNGNTVTAYQSSSVTQPATCVSESRVCNSGTLSGSYPYSSCTVNIPAGTTINVTGNVTIDGNLTNSGTIDLTSNSNSNSSSNPLATYTGEGTFTASKYTAANPGEAITLSWNVSASSCSLSSTDWDDFPPSGTIGVFPSGTRVVNPKVSRTYQLVCTSSGVLIYKKNINIAVPVTGGICMFDMKKYNNGASGTFYEKYLVPAGSQCRSEVRKCTDGVFSGSYTAEYCNIDGPSSITTNKAEYSTAEKITVSWTGPIIPYISWIAINKGNAVPNSYENIINASSRPVGESPGSYDFGSPSTIGDYTVYLFKQDFSVLASKAFKVTTTATPSASSGSKITPIAGTNFSVIPRSGEINKSIIFSFANIPSNAWIYLRNVFTGEERPLITFDMGTVYPQLPKFTPPQGTSTGGVYVTNASDAYRRAGTFTLDVKSTSDNSIIARSFPFVFSLGTDGGKGPFFQESLIDRQEDAGLPPVISQAPSGTVFGPYSLESMYTEPINSSTGWRNGISRISDFTTLSPGKVIDVTCPSRATVEGAYKRNFNFEPALLGNFTTGSDPYGTDKGQADICVAAFHAGVISNAGGTARLKLIRQPMYSAGSTKNGITTNTGDSRNAIETHHFMSFTFKLTSSGKSCSLGGYTIPDGDAIRAFKWSSNPTSRVCMREIRTCIDGVLDGEYQNTSCARTAYPAVDATPRQYSLSETSQTTTTTTCTDAWKNVIPLGSTVHFYKRQGSCVYLGAKKCGTDDFSSIQNDSWVAPWCDGRYTNPITYGTKSNKCYFGGKTYENGDIYQAYTVPSVVAPDTCENHMQRIACGITPATTGENIEKYAFASCTESGLTAQAPVEPSIATRTGGYKAIIELYYQNGFVPYLLPWYISIDMPTNGSAFVWPTIDWGDGKGQVAVPNTYTSGCSTGPICRIRGKYLFKNVGYSVIRIYQNGTQINKDTTFQGVGPWTTY